jgi:hypothetical protein
MYFTQMDFTTEATQEVQCPVALAEETLRIELGDIHRFIIVD